MRPPITHDDLETLGFLLTVAPGVWAVAPMGYEPPPRWRGLAQSGAVELVFGADRWALRLTAIGREAMWARAAHEHWLEHGGDC